ncbi:MAG TPA: hypothetical protein EYP33_02570 [Pyrodictium sp.]|nr:hypothetical protein [Pyrodictium sp.]
MRPGLLRIVAVFVLVAMLAPLTSPAAAATAPSLYDVKTAVQAATDYLKRLMRDGWVSEYPGLPLVWYDGSGNPYPVGANKLVKKDIWGGYEITYGYITNTQMQSTYYSTTTSYDVYFNHLVRWGFYSSEWTEFAVHVEIVQNAHNGYKHIKITVLKAPLSTGTLVIGDDSVTVSSGTSPGTVIYDKYFYGDYDSLTKPAARATAARHVNALAYYIFNKLGLTSYASAVEANVRPIMQSLFGSSAIRDFYNPLLAFLPGGVESVEPISVTDFYDAWYFTMPDLAIKLGYYIIYDNFFESGLYDSSSYPRYPYKSKLVSVAEASGPEGTTVFAEYLKYNDPLGWVVQGAYEAYQGNWAAALDYWNKIVSEWDGTGLGKDSVFVNSYSTVRLAAAVAFGSILAGHGKIDWDVVDQMANVLIQLQWKGVGYYKENPDAPVETVVALDHYGGFMTSYDEVASYGFVPYRSKIFEDILVAALNLGGGWVMDAETAEPLPTNSETTALAIVALMNYAYFKYGVLPSQLLS